MDNMRLAAVIRHPTALVAALALTVAACGGGGENTNPADTSTAAMGTPAATPPAGSTAAPAAGAGGPVSESQITPQMVAEGDSLFHGQVGGQAICYTCHGQDAKGTQLAPDLTDNTWLNGDGSYGFIVNTVTTGVPTPKQHPSPMPPMGGATLTQSQIQAVAAYVYSLTHPNVGKSG